MKTIEDQLLSNEFPCPKYYDGASWNTLSAYRRNSLPSYLKEGLPRAKYNRVREAFRRMDRFAPPEIGYFQKMITSNKPSKKKLCSRRTKLLPKRHIEDELAQAREEIQYALVMADRQSNLLVNLLEKASTVEQKFKEKKASESFFEKKLFESKVSRKSQLGCRTDNFFSNTIDLVFSLKKKQCVDKSRAKSMAILHDQPKQNQMNKTRLKTYSFSQPKNN